MQNTTKKLSTTEKQACVLLSSLTGISAKTLLTATEKHGYEMMVKNPTLLDISDDQKEKLNVVVELTNKGGIIL